MEQTKKLLEAIKDAASVMRQFFPNLDGCSYDDEELYTSTYERLESLVAASEESSPTPQVQSGLSAEEVLSKYDEWKEYEVCAKDDVLKAMEEYAASKVAEKEREIERLTGLLKGLHDRLYSSYPKKQSQILWDAYCEQNGIQNNSNVNISKNG